MRLIPVIEFEPYRFQSAEREIPDNGESWNEYWRDSLADSGIVDIEPYGGGGWMIETHKLTVEILEILLNKTCKASDEAGVNLDEMISLSGGYVLEVAETVFRPQCCGCLEDIESWETASAWVDAEEMTLWIGHPWLLVSSVDDRYLQIKRTAEYGEPEEPVVTIVDRYELKKAIIVAKEQLDLFRQVVLAVLPNVFPHLLRDSPSPTAQEIAARLRL